MFHANGWTFVWTVTAAGAAHVCLPKLDPGAVFEKLRRERVTALCAAPTVLIMLANCAGRTTRRSAAGHSHIDSGRAAGGSDHRAYRRRSWLDRHAGLRLDGNFSVHQRL